jgi:transcriptional regulator
MYIPKHFAVDDQQEIFAFIEAHSFGQLISMQQDQLAASHIPFLLAGDRQHLLCHLARQNPQWQEIGDQQVLVILPGPHDYISPAWYQNPGVPTWNYQAVHVHGRCRVFDSPDELKQVIDALTRKHEARFAEPWAPQYSDTMLKGIVGIEVEISDIQCKYKLSQNRPVADHQGVIDRLEELDSTAVAEAMRKVLL